MSKIGNRPRVSFEPFDQDILKHRGYKYSTAAPLSSQLSNNYLTQLTKQAIRKILSGFAVSNVIDLGCGDGVYTHLLAKIFSNLTLTGSDAAEQAIRLAQTNYPEIDFYVWNMMKRNTVGVYDVAILRGVIHHLPDPETGIKHAAQICQFLVVIEPNGWSPILKIIEQISPYHRAHHEKSYTSLQLVGWCRRNRLFLVSQKFVGLVPFFCPSFLARILKKIEPWVEKSWLAPLLCAQVVQIYQKKN